GAEARIGATFTDRLVVKFGLPVTGWRGKAGRARDTAAGATTGETVTEAMAHTADEEPGGHA
ncbi:MAG TPA: hypothetical protein VLM11_01650, partial [Streptosporangiaceae bacterium]|nr:hypothetical protein [Streptosporangiaceae bacterium]